MSIEIEDLKERLELAIRSAQSEIEAEVARAEVRHEQERAHEAKHGGYSEEEFDARYPVENGNADRAALEMAHVALRTGLMIADSLDDIAFELSEMNAYNKRRFG